MDDSERIVVGVVGVSNYPGLQLIRMLMTHPLVELAYVGEHNTTDSTLLGKRLSDIFPMLLPLPANGLRVQAIDLDFIGQTCHLVFLAQPHGMAWEMAPILIEKGCRVIDLSADYRLFKLDAYHEWYGEEISERRTDRLTLQQAVYGLPELYRDRLLNAKLVGCPGCYPTASLLAIAPLFKHGLVDTTSAIIDAKCGLSEGGLKPKNRLLFAEADNSISPYAVSRHRAMPEIEQVCSELAGHDVSVVFAPHRVPTVRGLLVTLYATLRDPGLVRDDLITIYQVFYRTSDWVDILSNAVYPQTKWSTGTNYCHIGIEINQQSGRVIIMAAIDNLMKGQAGQAIQCMNVMMQWDETLGLSKLSPHP
ncbi:MAG: N-acetyl-gamma-glutamyl-phosphate reductase [Cyanobacteria bacterium P01_F01_bin.150]